MQSGDGQRYRELASHFRTLAAVEPISGLRWHLRHLAEQHDNAAADLDEAQWDNSAPD
jgi:hypothetical protein